MIASLIFSVALVVYVILTFEKCYLENVGQGDGEEKRDLYHSIANDRIRSEFYLSSNLFTHESNVHTLTHTHICIRTAMQTGNSYLKICGADLP